MRYCVDQLFFSQSHWINLNLVIKLNYFILYEYILIIKSGNFVTRNI